MGNLILFIVNCKDLLLSFWNSKNEIVLVEKFSPGLYRRGLFWLDNLKMMLPNLKVYFVGSCALKIAGGKDLDYIIECRGNMQEKTEYLESLLGDAKTKNSTKTEWQLSDNGVNIDILMLYKKDRLFKVMMGTFYTIKNNKKLLTEYAKLKSDLNGKSRREYERRRMFFFNKAYYKYGPGVKNLFQNYE
jgi:hypothetical protein